MGPLVCDTHGGISWAVSASPGLANAIKGGARVEPVRLDIHQPEKLREYTIWIDRAFAEDHDLNVGANARICLIDRSRSEQRLNDRLMVVRLSRDSVLVCQHCLDIYRIS
jgi:hypothetical protein